MERLYRRIGGRLLLSRGLGPPRRADRALGGGRRARQDARDALAKGTRASSAIAKALEPARGRGFAPLGEPACDSLVVEYRLEGWGAREDLARRHALEDWLDETLAATGLGSCDGGMIGSGSMEATCYVVDYGMAKKLLARELPRAGFGGYSRIYRIAAPKPRGGARRKGAGFVTGDCLAARLADGRYTAAYVAVAVDDGAESHCVVVELDHLAAAKPTLTQFARMKPLILTHGAWRNRISMRQVPPRDASVDAVAEVVGNAPLKFRNVRLARHDGFWVNWNAARDRGVAQLMKQMGHKPSPRDPSGKFVAIGSWDLGEQIVMQEAWDAKRR